MEPSRELLGIMRSLWNKALSFRSEIGRTMVSQKKEAERNALREAVLRRLDEVIEQRT
jgi:hypothetical protein